MMISVAAARFWSGLATPGGAARKRMVVRLVAAAAVAGSAGPVAARYLVLQSSGPSAARFGPGTALPDDAAVRLAAGDKLLLLGKSGTRVFNGPGIFRPGRPPDPRSRARAEAAVRRAAAALRIELPGPESLWDLNLPALAPEEGPGRTQTFCALDPAQINVFGGMYRRAELRPAGGGVAVELRWRDDFGTAPWRPTGNSTQNDYQVAVGGERLEAPVRVRVVPLGRRPATPAAALGQLAELGCSEQAERLTGRLAAQARYFETSEGDSGWNIVALDTLR